MRKRSTIWIRLGKGLMALSAIGILALGAGYLYIEQQLPNVDKLKDIRFQVPLHVYTLDHKLIAEFGDKRRIPVAIDDIPPLLINAVLATEDQRFYQHPGFDPIGLLRAAWQLVLTGEKDQGGSTITMQVARNFFLSRQKTYMRKITEILLAIKIDKELSKRKILELYLNKIYLGNRAYGVGAAAAVYYGKSLADLTLAQLAMLAGLPKAPSAINPIANPQAAFKRRSHVLTRMLEQNYINQDQFDQASNAPITATYHGAAPEVDAPYIAEMVRTAMLAEYGESTYTKGLVVITTVNSQLQLLADRSLRNGLLIYTERHGYRGTKKRGAIIDDTSALLPTLQHFAKIADLQPAMILAIQSQSATALLSNGDQITLPWDGLKWAQPIVNKKRNWLGKKPRQASDIFKQGDIVYVRQVNHQWRLTQLPQAQGALVALDPNNGAILALSGGFDFQHSKFNRVIQAQRQPGSSFKPFIYSAALEKGLTLATTINDAPVVMEDPTSEDAWRPKNDNRRFYGPTRLRYGIIHSRNLVTVRLLQMIGIDFTREYAQRFGFTSEQLPTTLSLALGSGTATPLQMARAYATFANGGYLITPHFIYQVKDSDNNILYQAKPATACPTCYGVQTTVSNSNPVVEPLAPRIISPRNAYLMTAALQDTVQLDGPIRRRTRVLNRHDLAGKTGTTNDHFDAWFSGFNSDIVLTVWTGFDNPRSLHEYGSQLPLPIWVNFMEHALAGRPEHSLAQPPGIVTVRIDKKTGLPASVDQPNTRFEVFREENVPKQPIVEIEIDNKPNEATTVSTSADTTPEDLF